MQNLLSRRGWIRLWSYLAAAFLILFGLVVWEHSETLSNQRQLESSQLRAFQELSTAVDEVTIALQKASYTNSPDLIAALCTQVYGKAALAEYALSSLPTEGDELTQTAAFLTRVGDYAYSISKTAASDQGWTEAQRETWASLLQTAQRLDALLSQLEADLQGGNLTLSALHQAEEFLSQETDTTTDGSAYENMEAAASSLPTLIYDGPFSQHLEGRSGVYLEDLEEVSYAHARQAAAAILGVQETSVRFLSQMEGTIPGWMFSVQVGGVTYTIELSQSGGILVGLFSNQRGTESLLTPEKGVDCAAQWLNQNGFADMEETYYLQEDGLLTVNFAYSQDGVRCYPDLIKVTVALDDGNIVAVDTRGYLMNHQLRTIESPTISEADALSQVPEWVAAGEATLTIIPSDGLYDTLCYEIPGQLDGQSLLYYVNAQTGKTEKILLLLNESGGTVVV